MNALGQPFLRHSPPLQSRLAALLARPKLLAIACIAALTALGWIGCALVFPVLGSAWTALCRPSPVIARSATDAALVFGMWAAMTLAMMLPTASPMVLTYCEIADTAARVGEKVVSPLIIIAGYAVVWIGFSIAATAAQMAIPTLVAPAATGAPIWFAGAVLIAAGAYQFSALKHACLNQCRHPFPFFFANWTDAAPGVFRLGLRQGLYCLGCCWVLMLVMLAVGAMNVIWMAALGALMTLEKMTTTARVSRALGALLVVGGAVMFVLEWR